MKKLWKRARGGWKRAILDLQRKILERRANLAVHDEAARTPCTPSSPPVLDTPPRRRPHSRLRRIICAPLTRLTRTPNLSSLVQDLNQFDRLEEACRFQSPNSSSDEDRPISPLAYLRCPDEFSDDDDLLLDLPSVSPPSPELVSLPPTPSPETILPKPLHSKESIFSPVLLRSFAEKGIGHSFEEADPGLIRASSACRKNCPTRGGLGVLSSSTSPVQQTSLGALLSRADGLASPEVAGRTHVAAFLSAAKKRMSRCLDVTPIGDVGLPASSNVIEEEEQAEAEVDLLGLTSKQYADHLQAFRFGVQDDEYSGYSRSDQLDDLRLYASFGKLFERRHNRRCTLGFKVLKLHLPYKDCEMYREMFRLSVDSVANVERAVATCFSTPRRRRSVVADSGSAK